MRIVTTVHTAPDAPSASRKTVVRAVIIVPLVLSFSMKTAKPEAELGGCRFEADGV